MNYHNPYLRDNPIRLKSSKAKKQPLPQKYKYCAACQDFENPTTCRRPIRKGQSTTAQSYCKYWRLEPRLKGAIADEQDKN
jgi:hypothetical protein